MLNDITQEDIRAIIKEHVLSEDQLREVVRNEVNKTLSERGVISEAEAKALVKNETAPWKEMLNNFGDHVNLQINGLIDSVAQLTGKTDTLITASKTAAEAATRASDVADRAVKVSENALEVSNQALQASNNALKASDNAVTAAKQNTEAISAWSRIHGEMTQDIRILKNSDEEIRTKYYDMEERTDLNIRLGEKNDEAIKEIRKEITPMAIAAQRWNERYDRFQRAKEFLISKPGITLIATVFSGTGLATGELQRVVSVLSDLLAGIFGG